MGEIDFRQMADLLPQIVWVADPSGRVKYVNSQWSKYTGLTTSQSVGHAANRAIHPEDAHRVSDAWRDAIEHSRQFETEMRLRRNDGVYEWFLSRCIPVFEEGESGSESPGQTSQDTAASTANGSIANASNTKVIRWVGTSTNIDRRKRTEGAQVFAAELVVALRRMREPEAIADHLVRELAAYLDLDGCALLEYNTKTEITHLLGLEARTSEISTRDNAYWTEVAQTLHRIMDESSASAIVFDTGHDSRYPTDRQKDSALASDPSSHSPISTDNQESVQETARLVGAIATNARLTDEAARVFLVGVQDEPREWKSYETTLIQELASSAWLAYQRSHNEQQLRDQRSKFEYALEMAEMGTWEYDCESRTVVRSRSMDRIFGLSTDDGTRWVDEYYAHIHPDDMATVVRAIEASEKEGAPFEVEFRILHDDNAEAKWVAGRGAALRNEEGRVTRISGALINISDRKVLEAELEARANIAQFQAAVGTALAAPQELRVLLQTCTEAMVENLDAAFARIWTLNEFDQVLELQASAGMYTHLDGAHSRIEIGKYKIGRIAQESKPLLSNDVANDPNIGDPEWAKREGMVAFAGYPLVVEGHVVGVMAMFGKREFSPRDLQAMAAISNKVALTIERKRAEQALRESEERFRLALEDSPITVYTTDSDLRYTWIYNPPLELQADQMQGRRDDEIYTPEGSRELTRFKRDALAAGQVLRRVVEVANHQNYARYDMTAMPLRDENGQIVGLTVAAADITERERAETRLAFLAEASELLTASLDYSETLERLAQAVVPRLANWCAVELLVDGELQQVVVAHEDPAMVEMARDLRQKYPADMDAPQGVPAVIRTGRPELYPYIPEELLQASARDEEHWEAIRKVGMRSAMVVPLRLRDRILGALTMVWAESQRNYTEADLRFAEELARRASIAIENAMLYREARSAEANLRTLNETLEIRVQDRTVELERSNHELDRFAYVASHDLKAPLRAIDHLASWIEEDAGQLLPESSQEHLMKMRGRISRMESLLDDLLTYSRAGRIRGEATEVDIGELLSTVIETVSPPEGFWIDVPRKMPTLETYRVPLETVFRNLIGNAIKHHPSEKGHVEIQFKDLDKWIEFCVQDDGDGIRPEFHERIFEMFQTLRPRDYIEGSGIGLAVVKKIIESAGGTIRVESEPGEGATFYFTWPKVWRG